jgi:hypothetical protein
LLLACLTLHCADADQTEGVFNAALETNTGECRSFASNGSVRLGESTGQVRCNFDPVSNQHDCSISLAGATLDTAEEYASAADFVEAGQHMGKLTSLSETRTEHGRTIRTTHQYDELGRLVSSREERPGTAIVHVYADHDPLGRPRRARVRGSGDECGELLETIEYADSRRTISRTFQSADAMRCGYARQTVIERYDAGGNRLSIQAADGAGVETRFQATATATTQRVCL